MLRLTLLKSAVHPDPEQDQGHHAFTYALYPHEGDFIGGRVVQEAWELNNPLRTVPGQLVLDSLFSITGGHVLVDAVKRTEDGSDVLLRLHEYAGARSEVRIESGYSITAWQECSLMEEPEGEWQEQALAFQIKPYEIRTFRIRMGGKHNGEGIRS
ncbi:hypothetical protein D3C80_1423500 [compost metagenome]